MAKSSAPRPASPSKPRAPKAAVAAAAPTATTTARIISIAPAPLDPALVAMRAYQLFLESGCVHGHDVEHWLRAERDLSAGRLTSAA